MKEKEKKKKHIFVSFFLWGTIILCSIFAIVAIYRLCGFWNEYKINEDMINEVRSNAFSDDEDEEDYDYFDFNALLAINQYAVGWIKQSGDGVVDYPIVQYTDNDYYLTHSIDNEYSKYGTIFADCRIPDGLDASMCILWGHNMSGGKAMFGALDFYYLYSSYYENHPTFTIWNGYDKYEYQVFAYGYVETSSNFFTYSFTDDYTLTDWLFDRYDELTWTVQATLSEDDHIVVLATCPNSRDYSKRFVVLLYRID